MKGMAVDMTAYMQSEISRQQRELSQLRREKLIMDRNPIPKKYSLVMIEWLESRQPTSTWQFLPDFEPQEPVKCTSVGWLIREGDVKSLAQNMGDVDDDTKVSGVIDIPKCCVISITEFAEKFIDATEKPKAEQGNGTIDKLKYKFDGHDPTGKEQFGQ